MFALIAAAVRRRASRHESGGAEPEEPDRAGTKLRQERRVAARLLQLGFGYLVVGSITRAPRAGNPTLRLLRYPERLSLGNCMGMPNQGLAETVRGLAQRTTSAWLS
jgi:dihydroorotate dehydrogenase